MQVRTFSSEIPAAADDREVVYASMAVSDEGGMPFPFRARTLLREVHQSERSGLLLEESLRECNNRELSRQAIGGRAGVISISFNKALDSIVLLLEHGAICRKCKSD